MTDLNSQFASVYQLVRRIPRGRVLSYGDVGRRVGVGPRQVAAAMRQSPPGLPWHRVVGAGGRIVTPGETALEQRHRLMDEGVVFRRNRFPYARFQWKARS